MERRAWLGALSGREGKKRKGGGKVRTCTGERCGIISVSHDFLYHSLLKKWWSVRGWGSSHYVSPSVFEQKRARVCVCVYISCTTLFPSIVMDSANANAMSRHRWWQIDPEYSSKWLYLLWQHEKHPIWTTCTTFITFRHCRCFI